MSRGGYSGGRGGYHSGSGYRGGHGSSGSQSGSGGLDQGSHHFPSHQHHPTQTNSSAVVPGASNVTSKTPPAPEFEMKGNDFPALPGVTVAVEEIRKTCESDGSLPWESNR